MTTIAPGRKRLLATWDKHRDCDLASHLNAHGALPLTRRPEDVWTRLIAAVEMSGLAGRGGAGFPTARKLRLAKDSRASTLVVNSMEAEPESRKDWVLVNYAPHLVLDGAEVVALALGIERVVVCVAANQPQSVASLRSAIAERRGYRIIRP
ncbi:MAG TPA: hypothetical protein VEJ87_01175, partial [Acidimicrobiales bacterium]|nr:hypothetical protein [Acidimicrobiales bacterium]